VKFFAFKGAFYLKKKLNIFLSKDYFPFIEETLFKEKLF